MMTAIQRAMARLRGLGADRSGAVAMIFGLGFLCLVLMTGFGIDYYRWAVARSETQHVVDGAALSAAASHKKTEDELQVVVDAHVAANESNMFKAFVNAGIETETAYDEAQQVDVTIQGDVNTLFMGLIGVHVMPLNVNAVAQRGEAEAVELVLVLDNTGSMNQTDGTGQTRIAALKAAANDLVDTLKENEEADVRIGVVPYAEYVNVGTSNRGQSWLSLAEYNQYVPAKDNGKYPDEETYCSKYGPEYEVERTRQLDGRTETYRVKTRDCEKWDKRAHPNAGKKKPDSAAYTIYWRWEGCVYSRVGALRLSDVAPGSVYHGMIERDGKPDCMTPILPLTATKNNITSALNGMVTVINGREPQTYIPTGMIWGVNVLSPTAPFTEGRDYAANNRSPRKIMVVMTDGENTMRYRQNGHSGFGLHEVTPAAGQIKQTNDDVTAICNYAKSKNIEVYTVALGVGGGDALAMLRGCASDPTFFFDASDNAALGQAFRDIAASINRVRLVK